MPETKAAQDPDIEKQIFDERLRAARTMSGNPPEEKRAALVALSSDFPSKPHGPLELAAHARAFASKEQTRLHLFEAHERDQTTLWVQVEIVRNLIDCGFLAEVETVLQGYSADLLSEPDMLLQRAKLKARTGNVPAALDILETGRAKNKDHIGLKFQQARMLSELGRKPEAITALTEIADAGSQNIYAIHLLVQLLLETDDLERAKSYCLMGMQRAPDEMMLFRMVSQIFPNPEDQDVLHKEAKALQDAYPNAKGVRWLLAQTHLKSNRLEDALCFLDDLPTVNSERFAFLRLKLDVLTKMERKSEIESLLQAEISRAPLAVPPVILLAEFFLKNQSLFRALDTFKQAEALDPDDVHILSQKAKCLEKLGQRGAEIEVLEKLIRLRPSEISFHNRRAKALIESNRKDQALDVMRAMVERFPDDLWGLDRYIGVMVEVGERNAARDFLKTRLFDHPLDNEQLMALANVFRRVGEYKEEYKFLSRLIAQQPDYAAARQKLMARSFSLVDPSEIMTLLETHIPIDDPLWVEAKGLALVAEDRLDEALAHLRAIERPIRTQKTALEIAKALCALPKPDLALRYLKFCRRRWPDADGFFELQCDNYWRECRFEEAHAMLDYEIAQDTKFADRAKGRKISVFLNERNYVEAERLIDEVNGNVAALRVCAELRIRHHVTLGNLEKARECMAQARTAGVLYREAHWRVTLVGQLFNELELSPKMPDRALYGELRRIVRGAPQYIFPAIRLIDRAASERRLEYGALQETESIPKKIYQYWDDEDVPDRVLRFMESWQVEGYAYRRLNRSMAHSYLQTHYGPDAVRAYRLASNPAEGADFLRLSLLAQEGGIWADADDILRGDLKEMLADARGLFLYREAIGMALGNNFIAVRAHHPAIKIAQQDAQDALLSRSAEMAWSKTGPGLMTRAVAAYLASPETDTGKIDLTVIEQPQIMRNIRMHNFVGYKKTNRHWNARQSVDSEAFALLKSSFGA